MNVLPNQRVGDRSVEKQNAAKPYRKTSSNAFPLGATTHCSNWSNESPLLP